MTTVSVPGKIILMGEHAVVYGKPALIAAVDRRLRVTVSDSDRQEIISDEGKDYIKHIRAIVMHHFNIRENHPVKIEVSPDIPAGYHLGSSAAVAAGVVGALSYHLRKAWNPTLINQRAYEAEKYIHQNASGVDPAAVVSGGLIWYRKELDFLRSIWQFPFGIPDALNNFCLIDTGRPVESTGDMVAYVSAKRKVQSAKYEKLFTENEYQTKRVAVAIKEGNEGELIGAIRAGERTLEDMGVVSKKVIPLIREIEKDGGVAKILGGGGRKEGVGFLLGYHHNPAKWNGLPIQLGEEGIRLESK